MLNFREEELLWHFKSLTENGLRSILATFFEIFTLFLNWLSSPGFKVLYGQKRVVFTSLIDQISINPA